MLNSKNLDKLVSDALAIESEAAKEAGALGYMARALVQATMPHKNPGPVNVWGRRNGDFSMVIQPGYTLDKHGNSKNIGLPYGAKPRLVMAYISSEAVKTRSRDIILGRSLSGFMHQLGLAPTGGRWGTIPMLREQMRRLFSATVAFQYDGKTAQIEKGFRIASRTVLFWEPKSPHQTTLWESIVTLTQEFYEEIIERPVPLDMRALSALKGSSLALDIYCWLTYRMSYLNVSAGVKLTHCAEVKLTHLGPLNGVEQAVVSPAAISITATPAWCSYPARTVHTGSNLHLPAPTSISSARTSNNRNRHSWDPFRKWNSKHVQK